MRFLPQSGLSPAVNSSIPHERAFLKTRFGDILDPASVCEVAWRGLWVRERCWPITLHSQIGDTSIESRVHVPEESVDIGVQFFVHDSPLQFSVWSCREAIE